MVFRANFSFMHLNWDAIKWYHKRTQLYIFIIEAGIYRLNVRAIDMIGRDGNSLHRYYVLCESEWLIVDDRVARLEHWAICVGFLLLLLVVFAAHTALPSPLSPSSFSSYSSVFLFLAQPAHLSVYLNAHRFFFFGCCSFSNFHFIKYFISLSIRLIRSHTRTHALTHTEWHGRITNQSALTHATHYSNLWQQKCYFNFIISTSFWIIYTLTIFSHFRYIREAKNHTISFGLMASNNNDEFLR